MTASFEDTVHDFDLSFLRQIGQTPNHEVQCKLEKVQLQISKIKKKAIQSSVLIQRFHANQEQLMNLNNVLDECKEKHRQSVEAYIRSQQKALELEKTIELLQISNRDLEEKASNCEGRAAGMRSYVYQLETLVKEHEATIASLRHDNGFEKDKFKNLQRKIVQLTKEKTTFLEHLAIFASVVYDNKKLTGKKKVILRKYRKSSLKTEEIFSEDEIGSPNSPFDSGEFLDNNNVQESNCIKKLENSIKNGLLELETIDRGSIDTGIGSSIASSPPDYFPDSPFSGDVKNKTKVVDCGTSPHRNETTDTAHSIEFRSLFSPRRDEELDNSPESNTVVNKAVSPLKNIRKLTRFQSASIQIIPSRPEIRSIATSPIIFDSLDSSEENEDIIIIRENLTKPKLMVDRAVSPVKFADFLKSVGVQTTPIFDNETENTNHNLPSEHDHDLEIELILNTMKLKPQLITPIPASPRSCDVNIRRLSILSESGEDIVKIKEDNKKLQSNMELIKKEIMRLNNFIHSMDSDDRLPDVPIIDVPMINVEDADEFEIENDVSTQNCSQYDDDFEDQHSGEDDENDIIILNKPPSESISEMEGTMNIERVNKLQDSVDIECVEKNCTQNKKSAKVRKLTRLEKLRMKMLPKSKIKRFMGPPKRKLRNKTKCLVPNNKEQPTLKSKQKEDYAKAVLIWKHLISKPTDSEKNIKKHKRPNKIYSRKELPPGKPSSQAETSQSCERTSPMQDIEFGDSAEETANTHNKCDENQQKSQTMECIKDNANISKTDNSRHDSKARNKNTIENKNLEPRRSLRPVSHESRENSIDNNAQNPITQVDKFESQGIRGLRKSIKKTDVQHKRILRSSNQQSDSVLSNTSEVQKDQSLLDNDLELCHEVKERKSSNQQPFKTEQSGKMDSDIPPQRRQGYKRKCQEEQEIQTKRILRSSAVQSGSANNEAKISVTNEKLNGNNTEKHKSDNENTELEGKRTLRNDKQNFSENAATREIIHYDYDITDKKSNGNDGASENITTNKQSSILCKGIEKYGFSKMRNRNIPDTVVEGIASKLEEKIGGIIKLPPKDRIRELDNLVEEIKILKEKHFIAGLTMYLSDPTRKEELYNKDNIHPAPPMSKSEQVLLYILNKLRVIWPGIYDSMLKNIEYTLFRLNRTPTFEVIESMSHFYAILCRYIDDKSRLRLFLISAMYCIQFKSYPLIKQCLEVWMHILPLAHMGMAKSPLVTCCIYLLHFYKCEDKFNRVQDIRNILSKKYFYNTREWNEPKILEMFKSAILDVTDSPIEKKMLRLALIILAKRHGAKWCQNHLVKNMLKPLIEKPNVPERVKVFCVSVLGPLLKPYPLDMKVHCEIVINELIDMLKCNPSPVMQEAIYTSLIHMCKHSQIRVIQALLSWCPQTVSPDMKTVIKDFVKEKPVKVWKSILSQANRVE